MEEWHPIYERAMKKTVQNVQKLIDQDKSVREIAGIFGVSYTPMRMWMKRRGLSTNNTNLRSWTDDQLISAVRSSKTIADVLRKLELKVKAGNYSTINKYINQMSLCTDHMTGKSHGSSISPQKKPLEELLVEHSIMSRSSLKKRLLKEGVLTNQCSECKLKEWRGEKLVMVLDHINGVNNDNRIENLRMLCPNCNSQTPTFCRGS